MDQPSGAALKIALLVEASAAGVGRHVTDLALGLTKAGHLVHLVYSRKRLDSRFQQGIDQLQAAGARLAPLDLHHRPHPADILAAARVRRYLKEAGPFDLLHCHSTKAGLVGRAAAIGLQLKAIYTPNAFLSMSPVVSFTSKAGVSAMEWLLSRASDAIICVSPEEMQHGLKLGLPPQKLFLIPNGIEIPSIAGASRQRAAVRAKLGLSETDVCIGFVGRLSPQKAPQLLLQAFSLALPNLRRPARMVLIGDGPLRESIAKTISHLALSHHVSLPGALNGLQCMAAFDVFALSSCYEGFPYVLIEALASGLPIVSTAVGGAGMLVKQGENGFIVPVGEAEALAAALHRLVMEQPLRQRMAEASRQMSTTFTLERMLQSTLSVYRSLARDAYQPDFPRRSRHFQIHAAIESDSEA